MQVYLRPVLRIIDWSGIHAQRNHSSAHQRFIHRNKEVAPGTDGKVVREFDADRACLGLDQRGPRLWNLLTVGLAVLVWRYPRSVVFGRSECSCAVFPELDLIIIRTRIGCRIRNGNRNVLPKVVCPGYIQ